MKIKHERILKSLLALWSLNKFILIASLHCYFIFCHNHKELYEINLIMIKNLKKESCIFALERKLSF